MRKLGVVSVGMPGMLSYKDEVQIATRSGAVIGGDYRHGRDVFLREGDRDAGYFRDFLYRGIGMPDLWRDSMSKGSHRHPKLAIETSGLVKVFG
jgi:hypothetical protein